MNKVIRFSVFILMPGLGYVLLGEAKKLYVTLLSFYLVLGLGSVLRLYPTFFGFISILFTLFAIHLGTALHAVIKESKGRSKRRNGLVRWAFTTILFLFAMTGFSNSRTLMGFDRVSMSVPVMQPEIMLGEQLLVDTWAYNSQKPKRGDLVIHSFTGQRGVFLNRAIALEGETIEIIDGKVFIDGMLVEEDYVRRENATTSESMNMPLMVIPLNSYFVMGDNRDRSLGDSRFSGPVPATDIKGKVTCILYSKQLSRIGKGFGTR